MDLEEEGVSDGWMVDGVHLVTHLMVTDEQIEWAYEFFGLKEGSI